MSKTPAAAVADLDNVLNQIKTATAKASSDMHDQGGGTSGKPTTLNASTPAANDGDGQHAEGERARENVSDVKDQQALSHETTDGVADSPSFNDAGDSTGSVDETKADADKAKQNHHPDTQAGSGTSHPARTDNTKIASLLAIAEEYEDEESEEGEEGGKPPAPKGEGEGEGNPTEGGNAAGSEAAPASAPATPAAPSEAPADPAAAMGGDPLAAAMGAPAAPEGDPAAAMGGDPTMPTAEPSEEELAAILEMLGGVDPKLAAAIPDLPQDEDSLRKIASDEPGRMKEYAKMAAATFPDDVRSGFNFAANLFASLSQSKTAEDSEIEEITKQAMEDAGNVAEILAGVEEGGDPAMTGLEDPMAGGAPPEGEIALGGEGGDAGADAEALLAALQQAGVNSEDMIKAAAAKGFDPDRAKAILAKAIA